MNISKNIGFWLNGLGRKSRFRLAIIIGLIISILCGCEKPDLEQHTPAHLEKIMVLGHGGGGMTRFNQYFPLNTIGAVRKTIEGYGADGVELDIQFTSDTIPILYHSAELYERTNFGGPVCSHTWMALKSCYYRHNINAGEGENQAIVSLEEMLNLYKSYPASLFLVLEAKLERFCGQPYEITYKFAEKMNEVLVKANLPHRIIIEAKDMNFLNHMRLLNPGLKYLYYASDFDIGISTALEHQYIGFAVHHKNITGPQVKAAQDAGLWVMLFGNRNYEETISSIRKAPEIITSDNIPLTLGLLEKARNK